MADVPLMNNPMTTAQDVIKGGASGAPARLAVGSNGDVLTVTAGAVGWAAPSGGGGVLPTGRAIRTAGDLTSLTSTTFADLTSMSVTFTTGANPVLITAIATVTSNGANTVCLDIDQDGSRLGQTFGIAACDIPSSGKALTLNFTHVTAALSAASHTWKLQYRTTAGSATVYASTTITPLILSVVELAN